MRWPSGLAMIGVDGSGLRAVETGSKDSVWEPIWSPDGKWLAINDSQRTFLFESRGAQFGRKEIPRPCPGCLFVVSDWAERGGFLLGSVIEGRTFLRYATYQLDSEAFGPEPSAGVDGPAGAPVEQYPKLLPDERAFVGSEGNRLVVHELDGRPPRELLRLGEGARPNRLSLSRDGRWLTFIERTDESDIWLATSEEVAERP